MISRSKLQQLCEDCGELLYYSESINEGNTKELMDIQREIKQALRKIIIANEISDRMTICITGLQGVGKTTLMMNYYGIDEEIMNISTGRGERLPVFITESDIDIAKTYVVKIKKENDGYKAKKEEVTAKEFKDYSKAEDEDTSNMYMEIEVPRRYEDNESKVSFMLLPGFERNDSYWNTLIDFSVQSADTAIFVLAPESIASANNAQLVEKIKEIFGDNVIYAITHSDDEDDGNVAYKSTLMKLVEADSTHSDRFVCTGDYFTDDENDKWRKELQNAIKKFSMDPLAADQKNTEYLEKIIMNELIPAVEKIKNMVSDVTDELLTSFKHSTWLEAFDKKAADIRKKYQKSIRENFKISKNEDIKDLEDLMSKGKKQDYSSEIDGKDVKERAKDFWLSCKGIAGYGRKALFGENIKDIKNARELINNAMKDQNGRYRYANAFASAIATTTDNLCVIEKQDDIPQIGGYSGSTVLLSKNEDQKRKLLQDVTTILVTDSRKDKLVSKSPTDVMGAIAECGTQYFGLRMIDGLYSEQYIKVPELSVSKLSRGDVAKSIQDTEKFAMSVLGVTGLDLLGDGVLNFVPGLATALGVSVSAAGGIVTGLVGAGAAWAIIRDYNKLQIIDYYAYTKAINTVYEEVEAKYLEMYDDYISAIRSRIESYLIECNGANETAVNKQNAIIAIRNIQENLNSIREELKGDSYDPTKLIRG